MSWEHFELGLRALQHEERRAFLTATRAARVAYHADEKGFLAAVRDESTLAGLA
jgi:hypothetical protein